MKNRRIATIPEHGEVKEWTIRQRDDSPSIHGPGPDPGKRHLCESEEHFGQATVEILPSPLVMALFLPRRRQRRGIYHILGEEIAPVGETGVATIGEEGRQGVNV